jgi:magnesium chelatase family protein
VLARVLTATVVGINGLVVEVEVDVSNGLPTFMIVGLANEVVKESRERVRSALKNSGLEFPAKRIVVNLAPATVRKEGGSFDLPIAVGLAAASGQIALSDDVGYLVLGELSLDGSLRAVRGALAMVSGAGRAPVRGIILPHQNAREASVCTAQPVHGVKALADVLGIVSGTVVPEITRATMETSVPLAPADVDFAEVRGQEHAKRAIEVAAAGNHNIIMVGPPGSGKTMIARRIPTIMPPMAVGEAIETTKIFSVAGLLIGDGLLTRRPFRSPHHSISDVALVGGGRIPRPGEVSLAHHGVLFLDEFPEFNHLALESLRQPLEDKVITISRAEGSLTFPANFMLVAAMNPCPCGYYGDPVKECKCSSSTITRYQKRLSGPLLDRIDIFVDVPRIDYEKLMDEKTAENSDTVRKRVQAARQIQLDRFSGTKLTGNADMSTVEVKEFCRLDPAALNLLKTAMKQLHFTARAFHRTIKLARTVADLDS